MEKYIIMKNDLIIAEFYEEGYALDFIEYQKTLGRNFELIEPEEQEIEETEELER